MMKTGEVVRLVSVPFRLLSVPFISIPVGKSHGGMKLENHWRLYLNTQSSLDHPGTNKFGTILFKTEIVKFIKNVSF